MIYFADLHKRTETEETVFEVLRRVEQLALELRDLCVGFLGDWFHVRYALPVHLALRLRRMLAHWDSLGIKLFILPGNHDQIDVAGQHVWEVFSDFPNVKVFTVPEVHPSTGVWLPYRKNPQDLLDWLALPDVQSQIDPRMPAHYHGGIVGAYMNNHIQAGVADGLPPEAFSRFPTVYCGHWHRHQVILNCVYAGSPWQTRADEAGQDKFVLHAPALPGMFTGPTWRPIRLDVGRRFHSLKELDTRSLGGIRPGDLVKVPDGLSAKDAEQLVSALRDLGAEVLVPPSAKAYAGPRSGLESGAPLRAHAVHYVESQPHPEGVDAAQLLAIFDEVVAR